MLDLLLFFILGLFIGALSGCVPGLHPNLISAVAVLQDIEYEKKAILIVSIYAGHLIFSYIPSIFFGIPDERTAVSVLPGQRMVQQGNGMLALKTMVVAALVSSVAAVLLIPFAMEFYPIAYSVVKPYIAHILILASAIFVFKTKNPIYSGMVFLAAGVFGAHALRMEMSDPFLPLFSGFFAMGAILHYRKSEVPKQKNRKIGFGILKFALIGVLFGGLANLIPAISSAAQVAALASLFIAFETEAYLAAIAAINVGQFVFAFASSASIGKARHGVMVNLNEIINIEGNMQMLLFYFLLGIAIAGLAVFLLRKKISMLANVEFSLFNKMLAAYLLLVVFLLDGFAGVMVFAIASLIGYFTIKLDVERTMMMGGIILPTMLLLV